MNYLAPPAEIQAGRSIIAAADQLTRFGFNVIVQSDSSATFSLRHDMGEFEISGNWPTMYVTRDIAADIQGWANNLIVPIGERGSGQGSRWDNQRATDIIHQKLLIPPEHPDTYPLAVEFLKVAIEDLPFIGFHGGIKFVPYNSTYWTNFPTAANPHNGPWWWWSCFKYIVTELRPR
jgi:peptide/nickel transport system substrate-binding protein